jgi:hypothetical protein
MPKKVTTTNFKVFLTYMDYCATGEGLTIEYLLSMTNTPAEAVEKHLDKFVGDRKESRDYFRNGIVVTPIGSKKAKTLLEMHFKNVDWLQDQLKRGGIEFHWKYYVNHS